ncbi:MAG TPA: zf-HC2 domain-containing protein [Thermoanaerobaculia bacterium]|jgi:hypothetical protein
MSDRNQELNDALAELAAARGSEPHPDPDELAAYHAGELSPERESRIQDHLAACRECAALLLDLDSLADPGFGAGSGAAGKEDVWQRLRDEAPMRKEGTASAPVVPFRRRTVPSSPRWLQTLAAALLVATVGLSLWVSSLRRTVQELSQPQPAPVLVLSGAVRGEGSGRIGYSVPATAFATLILIPPPPRSTRYRVVIERSSGEEVWSRGGLAPDENGYLGLKVSPRAMGPGDYRVRLLGPGGEPIEEYALRVL